jgi:hypothetical protein
MFERRHPYGGRHAAADLKMINGTTQQAKHQRLAELAENLGVRAALCNASLGAAFRVRRSPVAAAAMKSGLHRSTE